MTIVTLKTTEITVDSTLQPRVCGIDPDHVRDLESVAEHWPPLKVVSRDGRHLLVDGFHRFAAAQNLRLETVPAIILDTPESADLHALAFALNAEHGRPLTLSDRRAFAARLLQQYPEWSDREIGRRCGLVQPTVAKVRQELESQAHIPPVETRVGRDGRSYSASQKGVTGGISLGTAITDVLTDMFSPAERRAQRRLVRYFEQLAEVLEQQESAPSFETFDQAAEACRAVLGTTVAQELGGRLGWTSANILAVARLLGYRDEQ